MLDSLKRQLEEFGRFGATLDNGILRVTDSQSQSSYVVEEFSGSLQIRQAVAFDVPQHHLNLTYALANCVNERFTGCKSFIDRWGNLVNATDILPQTSMVEATVASLAQIEFVSRALLVLYDCIEREDELPSEEQIDAALMVPLE